jgi:8-amino-7-oxononanoate synthase
MTLPRPGLESLEARSRNILDAIRRADLVRTLQPARGLDLASNDYLSLSRHPAVKQRMIDAVARDGCGSTGSRLMRGQHDAFTDIERAFASFKGTERALYFSSGYLANLAVMTTFPDVGDVIFSDERNHASVIDGIRLSRASRVIVPHNDPPALARHLDDARDGHAFVAIESLFSMDGDIARLVDYAAVCRDAGAILIVDEAHAVGVFGARGSGLVEAAAVDRDVFLTVNTAGKALGASGAFVAGPAWAIEQLIQRARTFIFSTAPPPAIAEALHASLSIVTSEPDRRRRLLHLAKYCRTRLNAAGIAVPPGDSPIIPVVIGENREALMVADAVQAAGFDVRAIRPPSVPVGTARLRLTVNVSLEEACLDRFAVTLASAMRECSRWSAVSS